MLYITSSTPSSLLQCRIVSHNYIEKRIGKHFFDILTDKPSAPEGPLKFSDLTENSVELSWKPSKSDGGTPITNYNIEVRESRRSMWGKAGSVDGQTTKFIAKKLVVDNEYIFRIKAVNSEGESQPLEGAESVTPKKKLSK